jgi:hypothetical protein
MSDDGMRVKTEENELTLREMSESLPDSSTIMAMVGHCWWHAAYAARGGNWALALYNCKRINKLDNRLKVLRPKHRERLDRFQSEALAEVLAAIEAQDLDRFETAYAAATKMANEMHVESGYPYIKWELPEEPPKGLELGPVEVTETPS